MAGKSTAAASSNERKRGRSRRESTGRERTDRAALVETLVVLDRITRNSSNVAYTIAWRKQSLDRKTVCLSIVWDGSPLARTS